MSSWLDNIAAEHGEEEDEEESEEEVPPVEVPEPLKNEPVVQQLVILDAGDSLAASEAADAKRLEEDDNGSEVSCDSVTRPGFVGPLSPAMTNFASAAKEMFRNQERAYVGAIIGLRRSLNATLRSTSQPIQIVGEIGKLSNEAKKKFGVLSERIAGLRPLHQLVDSRE